MTARRIAMTSLYLPSGSKIGVGHQVHALANCLSDRGHDVTVFSACAATYGARYRTETMTVEGANQTFKFAWRLRAVDFTSFDIIHAHGDDTWLPRHGPVPRIRTVHGSCLAESRRIEGRREKLRMLLLAVGEIVSSATADWSVAVSANTYPHLPWIGGVIPNGVALERFAAGPPLARSTHPSILFVGTYERRKRGRLLAEVFLREIVPAVPGAELWMVCDDAPDLGPQVKVLGRVDDERLAELYRRAWTFCLPSSYEGFGIPYVEAMAAGTPIVATPNPGALEICGRGRLGLLSTQEELGGALIRMLTDSALRAQFAERAAATVRRYDLATVATRYEELYERLLAAR